MTPILTPTPHNIEILKHFLMRYCLDEAFWHGLSDADKYSSLENQARQAIRYINEKLLHGNRDRDLDQVAYYADSSWHRIASFLNLYDYAPNQEGLTERSIALLKALARELHWNTNQLPCSQTHL
ncbi:MAG: hypothetical protein GVY17_00180 [Cyanobacteria bacterium]|nr:hypothetical protein [Cyanobacteria bacterium GSL.Bin21]